MKTENPFNFSIEQLHFIAVACVLVNIISEKFGTYPSYSGGRFSQIEMAGVVIPLLILIIPIFAKNSRKKLWSTKNIVMTVIILIVNILLIMVMYTNKDYYQILWVEEGHWTRDNCPPIRWDIWNIIGKSAQ